MVYISFSEKGTVLIMNLASIVILAVILIITGFAIFKTVRSKGACEDCNVNTCPVKGAAALPVSAESHSTKKTDVKHDCCN